jgi:DNA-binding LacI/PurR family transcriptional regulator
MAQPYLAMATAAIEGLQKLANGEKLDCYQLRFEANFIIRESTTAVP